MGYVEDYGAPQVFRRKDVAAAVEWLESKKIRLPIRHESEPEDAGVDVVTVEDLKKAFADVVEVKDE